MPQIRKPWVYLWVNGALMLKLEMPWPEALDFRRDILAAHQMLKPGIHLGGREYLPFGKGMTLRFAIAEHPLRWA
jgi:hypothetical protein